MKKTKLMVLLALSLSGAGVLSVPSAQAAPWSSEWPKVSCARGAQDYNGKFRVKALQHLLRDAGYKVGVDGNFGKQTEAAVRSFQRRRGLAVTGRVANAEWAALTPTLRRGDKGSAVRALQITLNNYVQEHGDAGDRAITVDGTFGGATAKLLRSAQKGFEKSAPGTADAYTWFSLLFDEH